MKARHVARELALMTLFQLDSQLNDPVKAGENSPQFDPLSGRDLTLSAVRTLVDQAREMVQDAASDLAAVTHQIMEEEARHSVNADVGFDDTVLAAPLPNTRQTVEKIERCLQAAELLTEAMRIPEFAVLSQYEDVQTFANRLLKWVHTNLRAIDTQIETHSKEWRVHRMARMDRCLLRLAVAELLYAKNIDPAITINEAVDLAKLFSNEESFRFINGVLGSALESLNLESLNPQAST